MRIKKVVREVDEDDVQIVYETPVDEDCQFIEAKLVNPPLGQTSKASGSRIPVIAGRKRPANPLFTIPRENAACKRPALEEDNFEQPFLVQPTTSQHSGESTAINSSPGQQPSNSGTAEQLTQDRDDESSDSVATEVKTFSILMPRGGKPTQIYSENGNQQCWSDPSTSGTQNDILNTYNAVVHNLHETAISKLQSLRDAISMTTQSDIASIPQTNNVNNIPSTILTNQQQHSFGQDSQEDEQQTMITETEHDVQVIVLDDNVNFHPLISQEEETYEQHNSQRTQQQVQSNVSVIPENINVVLANQQRVIEDYNNQQHLSGTTTRSDIVSIPQTNNENNNIPYAMLTNQQHHSFGQNSQDEQQTMITEPEHDVQVIVFDDNINFQPHISQQKETFEQPNSQRTQQQAQSNIGVIPENINVVLKNQQRVIESYNRQQQEGSPTTISDIVSIPENINVVLENQQRVIESYNRQQQAGSPNTISDIVSIPQTNNTNDNIPSARNQRLSMFEQNSQANEQQTMSMITEPSIHVIEEIMSVEGDNISTEALVNQQEIIEQDDSQDSQQQGLSMTTHPDTSQENTDIAGENNNSSDPLFNRIWSLSEKVNKWIQNSSKSGWQKKRRRSNTLAMQERLDVALRDLHEIINGTTNSIHPRALINPSLPFLKSNSISTLEASVTSSNNAVSSNQINEVTITPLTVTQTGDLLGSTERQRLVINSSFFMKTEQHLVWKGSIECRKKRNGSQVTQPLNCSIYGLKTESGNINVNADLWPKQLVLLLLPSHLLQKQDLCKDLKTINRHSMIYFEQRGGMANVLQKSMIYGWMGFIQFPSPCDTDMMIVLYIPQKSVYIGFIANNESGFITKFKQVCQDYHLELQQKRNFLPSSSHQTKTPPQPPTTTTSTLPAYHPANLMQSSSQPTSLPLPAHQQPTLPQLSHQQTSLPSTSHQQPVFPLPSHHQTNMSHCPCQHNTSHNMTTCWPLCPPPVNVLPPTSHLQTSVSQPAHLQTSLPQPSHLQTSLPQPTNLQASLSQPTHLQTSLPQPTNLQASLPQPTNLQTSLSQPINLQASLSQPMHLQNSLPQSSHLQNSLPQPTHIQISLPQPTHPQNSLPQPTHIQISLPQMQVQNSLPQASHIQTSLPQTSHMQNTLPHSSHIQDTLPQPSHMPNTLPQSSHIQNTFPRTLFPWLHHTPKSLRSKRTSKQMNPRLYHRPNNNLYDTADRTIDAYISAIRQSRSQGVISHSSQGAGPSTSLQPLTQPGTSQGSEANNAPLIQTSAATYSFPPACSQLLESQASEIFPESLVKEVIAQSLRAYNSLEELCDAIIEYEERKCKKESTPIAPKETKSKGEETNEALLCKICMDEQMNMMFEPCGHLSTCLECSRPLYKCPMCRTVITNKRRIYMS